jgi:hypothetical protein
MEEWSEVGRVVSLARVLEIAGRIYYGKPKEWSVINAL